MGALRRWGERIVAPETAAPRWWVVRHGPSVPVTVVGTSSRRELLESLWVRARRRPVPILLLPEPGNPHDGNAVAVVAASQVVGYLARPYARLWQPVVLEELAAGRVVPGEARLVRRRRGGVGLVAEVVQPAPCLPGEPAGGLPLPFGLEALPRLWPPRPPSLAAALERGLAARRERRDAAREAAYEEWAFRQVRRRRRAGREIRFAAALAVARRGPDQQWTRTVPPAVRLLRHHLAQCPPPYDWEAELPLGIYRLDLFCEHAMLAVEVDGPEHRRAERRLHDQERDRELRRLAVATLRVSNKDVTENPTRVAALVFKRACRRTGVLAQTNPDSPYHGWTSRDPLVPTTRSRVEPW